LCARGHARTTNGRVTGDCGTPALLSFVLNLMPCHAEPKQCERTVRWLERAVPCVVERSLPDPKREGCADPRTATLRGALVCGRRRAAPTLFGSRDFHPCLEETSARPCPLCCEQGDGRRHPRGHRSFVGNIFRVGVIQKEVKGPVALTIANESRSCSGACSSHPRVERGPYRYSAAGLHSMSFVFDGRNAAKGSRQTSRVPLEDSMAPETGGEPAPQKARDRRRNESVVVWLRGVHGPSAAPSSPCRPLTFCCRQATFESGLHRN